MFIFYADDYGKSVEHRFSLVEIYSKKYLMRFFPRDYKGVFRQILDTLFYKGCVHINDRCVIVDLMLTLLLYKPSLSDFSKLVIVKRDG